MWGWDEEEEPARGRTGRRRRGRGGEVKKAKGVEVLEVRGHLGEGREASSP